MISINLELAWSFVKEHSLLLCLRIALARELVPWLRQKVLYVIIARRMTKGSWSVVQNAKESVTVSPVLLTGRNKLSFYWIMSITKPRPSCFEYLEVCNDKNI